MDVVKKSIMVLVCHRHKLLNPIYCYIKMHQAYVDHFELESSSSVVLKKEKAHTSADRWFDCLDYTTTK
jgi:hypothetical protein